MEIVRDDDDKSEIRVSQRASRVESQSFASATPGLLNSMRLTIKRLRSGPFWNLGAMVSSGMYRKLAVSAAPMLGANRYNGINPFVTVIHASMHRQDPENDPYENDFQIFRFGFSTLDHDRYKVDSRMAVAIYEHER